MWPEMRDERVFLSPVYSFWLEAENTWKIKAADRKSLLNLH